MTGEYLITEICKMLKKEGRLLTDAAIVNKLREFDYAVMENIRNRTN